MRIEPMNTICFTGKRPKDLPMKYDANAYGPLIQVLDEVLERCYQQGFRNFINGMAQGWDQIAFWTVHNRLQSRYTDVRNICYVPFRGQQRKWAMDGVFSQKQYSLALSLADDIHYCTTSIDLENMDKIRKALTGRNHEMVEDSIKTIALYPSNYTWRSPETSKGSGTAECMRYSCMQHHDMIVIDPFTLSVQEIICH